MGQIDGIRRIDSYSEFLATVEKAGFLFLSDIHPEIPSVSSLTRDGQWHTGETDSDPWQWKDRAALEKRLAYGCILGGHKGFVAPQLYAAFLRFFRPDLELEEQWFAGSLKPAVWQVWQKFEAEGEIASPDLNRFWKSLGNKGTSGVESAVRELQRTWHVTVAGNRQRVGRDGVPYGWHHLVYERVDDWAPEEWTRDAASMSRDEAWSRVFESCGKLAPALGEREWKKVFGIRA